MSEYSEVEKPFLDSLATLGWTTIDQGAGVPGDPAKSLRASFRELILPNIFAEAVKRLNRTEGGQAWLTDRQIDDLKAQITRQPNKTMLEANEAIQDLLFKTQVDLNEVTGESDPIVRLIDFANPDRNTFHAINQFRIDTPGCVKAFIIPDIVLFVNGIPLVVIEAKVSGPNCAQPMAEAFTQLQRYMGKRPETLAAGLKEGEPRLFQTNLFNVRTTWAEADFGTITSGEEHFYPWKTQWPNDDAAAKGMSQQEQLINGMLTKANLISILRSFSVFMDTDAGPRIKVVCRYQQFRAANKIIEKLRHGETADERSGVVWHTQGSGKSLTMVFVARMLRAAPDLSDYKILLINDRVDLEDQLGETAKLIGGRVNVIDSTKALRQKLSGDTSDVNMVMVHKFQVRQPTMPVKLAQALGTYKAIPTAETFGVVNTSPRIVLMIDEAHRTQGSDLGDNIFEAFPNAARLAFTGTPLITERHGEKKTVKRFGEYIDEYKLMDAVHDGATLQILYEGRTADAALNDKSGFDEKFENLFIDRTDEEMLAIKKKYGATGDIFEAKARIEAIAKDMVAHYLDHIYPNGFKAQVVCHSKLAAVRYKAAIDAELKRRADAAPDKDAAAAIAFLKSAVVISSDGTNEAAYVTQTRKEARALGAVENFCRSFDMVDPDKANTGVAFLIVCDMLLTGFDAPIEQVMYIDKKITEHTLLQAIARTNRVKKGKSRGYVVDYVGLTAGLIEALKLYAATGYQKELRDGLKNITNELPVLEERYQRLIQMFREHRVQDIERFLTGDLDGLDAEAEVVKQALRVLKNERLRADFDVYLKKFLNSLDVILPNPAGHIYRVPAKRLGYLQAVTKERYKDSSLNLRDAGEKVRGLINEHLISLGINPKVPPVELLDGDFIEKLGQGTGGDDEAKASEMEHAIRKHCTVHHDEDPAFYKSLSEKVENLITQHRDDWGRLAEELAKLRAVAIEGRKEGQDGMSREATTFFEHIANEVFEGGEVPETDQPAMRDLMEALVDTMGETIGSIDFWNNADKQRRLRGEIKKALLLSSVPTLKEKRDRVAVEVMSLAKNRHNDLLRRGDEGDQV